MKITYKTSIIAFLAILIVMFVRAEKVGAVGSGEELGQTITVDGVSFTLRFDTVVSVGEVMATLQITDSVGNPVEGAVVEARITGAELVVQTDHTDGSGGGHAGEGADGHDTEANAVHGDDVVADDPAAMPEMGSGSTAEESTIGMEEHGSDEGEDTGHGKSQIVAMHPSHSGAGYEGKLTFVNAGEHAIEVTASIDGKVYQMNFPVKVVGARTGALVLGSFGAINMAIILFGYILKKNSSSSIAPLKDAYHE